MKTKPHCCLMCSPITVASVGTLGFVYTKAIATWVASMFHKRMSLIIRSPWDTPHMVPVLPYGEYVGISVYVEEKTVLKAYGNHPLRQSIPPQASRVCLHCKFDAGPWSAHLGNVKYL